MKLSGNGFHICIYVEVGKVLLNSEKILIGAKKLLSMKIKILSPYCFVQKRSMSAKSWLFVLISEHMNSEPSIKAMQCPAGTRTRPATRYFFRYPTRPDSVLEISG